MPVTAKLSRRFYEKFGDDIANELVDWFNMVDATYRSELRELNELNYARFDAKLEQRVVELDAKIDRLATELRAEMHAGFTRLEALFDSRLSGVDSTFNSRLSAVDSTFNRRLSAVDSTLAQMETRLTKWMFGFWIAQAATTVGLVFGVLKLLH